MKKHLFILAACLLCCLLAFCCSALADDDNGDEHPMGAWFYKIEPTCTRKGQMWRNCLTCDHWEQKWVSALPHTPDNWVVSKEPTCTQKGVAHATCTVCGGSLRKELDKLGHDWQVTNATVQPTCLKGGKGEQTCSRCGKTKNGAIKALGHDWGEWTVTKIPTGKKRGTRERVCTRCGKKQTENFHEEGSLYEGVKKASDDVIRLQVMLRDLGYYKGNIKSGSFGAKTGEAVGAFQKDNGLTKTNVADVACIELIRQKWEEATGQKADEIDTKAIKEASKSAK